MVIVDWMLRFCVVGPLERNEINMIGNVDVISASRRRDLWSRRRCATPPKLVDAVFSSISYCHQNVARNFFNKVHFSVLRKIAFFLALFPLRGAGSDIFHHSIGDFSKKSNIYFAQIDVKMVSKCSPQFLQQSSFSSFAKNCIFLRAFSATRRW